MRIQSICKQFREVVLNKTLSELSNESGVNLKTISAFEHGRSNNLKHIEIYVNSCEDDDQLNTLFYNLKTELMRNYKK